MTVFGIDLYLAAHEPWAGELLLLSQVLHSPWHWRPMADLFLLGLAGGFFTVPLYTWLQTAAPEEFRSQAIAANNIVNGLYMVAAAAASALILALTDSLALLFLLTALANVPALGRLCWRAPQVWQARWSWLTGLCGR